MTVAVLDTGVQPHLAMLEKNIARLDLVNESSVTLTNEHAWHGTAVASIIAGNSPDLRGLAPSAGILSIKVMGNDGTGNTFTLARGIIEAADRGARVINICMGTYSSSQLLEDAVNYAVQKGVAIVASAGNDGVEGVSYPARYDGVIAVSGVDASERHVYFANRGPQVDLAAPAVGVGAAWDEDRQALFSGTSAAAPFVSGALAWLMAANPAMSAEEATRLLYQYANDSVTPGRDEEVGEGILNVRRVRERGQKGIYDVGLAPLEVSAPPAGERFVTVSIMAQNRGTEPLSTFDMRIEAGQEAESAVFYNVGAGQSVRREKRLDAKLLEREPITVLVSVSIRGMPDAYPADNQKSSTISARK